MPQSDRPRRVLIIGCGALARELLEVVARNRLAGIEVRCLPASLHNRPADIPAAVDAAITAALPHYASIFVAYGDCGTGGRLDSVLDRYGIERLPGAHCYEFFAGGDRFAALHDTEPGTFYLTDFLVRHFERIVWRGLGLDRHPQLRDDYFRHYRRVVYLSQHPGSGLVAEAAAAADRLGLAFEHRPVGYGDLETAVVSAAAGPTE